MAKELTKDQISLGAKLTKLQYNFVLHLVAGKSKRKAYYAAGGKAKSGSSADVIAVKMLKLAKVSAFYECLIDNASANAAIMTREEAMIRLSKIARTQITDIADFRELDMGTDEDGEKIQQTYWTIKDSANMPDVAAASIKSVKATNKGLELELHDAPAAIKQLGAMQGWDAPKKLEHDLSDPLAELIDSIAGSTIKPKE